MCRHGTLVPPASPTPRQNCTRTFPGRPEQISRVRALLAHFLDGFPTTDDALLLASELATNAINHSASGKPAGTFTIRARRCGNCLNVEIEDQGSAWDGRLALAEAPHGLYLLRALSAACGTLPRPTGWVTWFTLTPSTSPEGEPAQMTHDHNPPVPGSQTTGTAAQLITDQLTAHGFGVQTREWDEVRNLTVVGVEQARSCLTVTDGGHLRWDYQPSPGPDTSPAAVTQIILHLLGAAPAEDRPLNDGTYPAFPVKGAAGRLLQDHGLKVALETYEDLESFDVVAEIHITNPGQPGRGMVTVNDNGDIEWECQASQAFNGEPAAIVAVIAPILTRAPATRREPASARNGHPQP
jgi:hypothetical protein